MPHPASPYSLPELYACQHRDQLPDLEFYLQLAEHYGSDILELGCGTGRLSVALVQHGLRVTGVDIDERMLGYAGQQLMQLPGHQRVRLELVHMDILQLQLARSYDLVIFPYHSIGHIAPGQPLRELAAGIARHLRRSGGCVLSLLQPDAELCRPGSGELRLIESFEGPDGNPVDCYESTSYSAGTRRLHFDWYYDTGDDDQLLHIANDLTLHEGEAVRQACAAAGLVLDGCYGDFDLSPWSPDSPELLQVYRRFH